MSALTVLVPRDSDVEVDPDACSPIGPTVVAGALHALAQCRQLVPNPKPGAVRLVRVSVLSVLGRCSVPQQQLQHRPLASIV